MRLASKRSKATAAAAAFVIAGGLGFVAAQGFGRGAHGGRAEPDRLGLGGARPRRLRRGVRAAGVARRVLDHLRRRQRRAPDGSRTIAPVNIQVDGRVGPRERRSCSTAERLRPRRCTRSAMQLRLAPSASDPELMTVSHDGYTVTFALRGASDARRLVTTATPSTRRRPTAPSTRAPIDGSDLRLRRRPEFGQGVGDPCDGAERPRSSTYTWTVSAPGLDVREERLRRARVRRARRNGRVRDADPGDVGLVGSERCGRLRGREHSVRHRADGSGHVPADASAPT